MRPEDLRTFLKAAPFRPFRITMTSGRSFDVRHPEMLNLTRSTALIFNVADDGIAESFEMFSLLLIESAKPIESPVSPQGNGQTSA